MYAIQNKTKTRQDYVCNKKQNKNKTRLCMQYKTKQKQDKTMYAIQNKTKTRQDYVCNTKQNKNKTRLCMQYKTKQKQDKTMYAIQNKTKTRQDYVCNTKQNKNKTRLCIQYKTNSYKKSRHEKTKLPLKIIQMNISWLFPVVVVVVFEFLEIEEEAEVIRWLVFVFPQVGSLQFIPEVHCLERLCTWLREWIQTQSWMNKWMQTLSTVPKNGASLSETWVQLHILNETSLI